MPASADSCILGIDVGGTKIAAGLIDPATGAVSRRESIATAAARGGPAILEDTLALARRLAAAAAQEGRPVARIGVGVPQLVDVAQRIKSAHNFDWTDQPVRQRLAEIAPATIESDVRAAARAEAAFGAGRGHDPFAYVTIGTGISYCLVLAGRPYAGAKGYAIHFASSALHVRCSSCGHVEEPVLEELAAGPALARRYAAAGGSIAGAEAVLAAVDAGEPAAVAIIADAADSLGALLGNLVNMLDPAAIVMGGGLGLAPGLYRQRLVASTRAHIWAEDRRDLPILSAALGADAGIIGAALSAFGAQGLTAKTQGREDANRKADT
jgi:glucokinase